MSKSTSKPISNMEYLGNYMDVIDHMDTFKLDYPESDGHNPNCAIDSQNCSLKMADDVNDLCLWHRYRIGQHTQISCNCKSWTCLLGDTRSKQLASRYYNIDYTPVITHDSQLQCCNNYSKGEFVKCGIMLVCKDHMKDHK